MSPCPDDAPVFNASIPHIEYEPPERGNCRALALSVRHSSLQYRDDVASEKFLPINGRRGSRVVAT